MNIEKFNKETRELKLLKNLKQALHPLRQQQIKRQVLASLNQSPAKPKASGKRLIWRERLTIYTRHAIPIAIVFLLLGATVYASNASKPGDALFAVKKASEKIELSFAVSAESEATLKTKFANKRAGELDKISREPELNLNAHIKAQTEVSNAIDDLEEIQVKLETKGNTQAAEAVSQTISRLQERLSEQKAREIKLTGKIVAQGAGFVLIQGSQTWKLFGQIDFSAFTGKIVQVEGLLARTDEIQAKKIKSEDVEIDVKGAFTEDRTPEQTEEPERGNRQKQKKENSSASSTPSGQDAERAGD